jgi:hypothetical protein
LGRGRLHGQHRPRGHSKHRTRDTDGKHWKKVLEAAFGPIDFRTIGDGKTGPVTRALQAEFEKLTSGRHARSAAWFSPVPAFEAALSQA